jgi:(p)ppGpp synthase/HD superfamily hydrolase
MVKSFKYIQALKVASTAAALAHDGQVRKHQNVPYIVHPARVAQLVIFYNPTAYHSAIAAWMHDILEDCGDEGRAIYNQAMNDMHLTDIEKTQITDAVLALTKNDDLHPRSVKNKDCIKRLISSHTPRFAVLVKICDRIDNLMDMEGFESGFVRMYLNETKDLIDGIGKLRLDGYEVEAFNNLIEITNTMESLYQKK